MTTKFAGFEIKEVRLIKAEEWQVKRIGRISEVVDVDDNVRWVIEISDEGRLPFIQQVFGHPGKAENFYDNMQKDPPAVGAIRDIRKKEDRNGNKG